MLIFANFYLDIINNLTYQSKHSDIFSGHIINRLPRQKKIQIIEITIM